MRRLKAACDRRRRHTAVKRTIPCGGACSVCRGIASLIFLLFSWAKAPCATGTNFGLSWPLGVGRGLEVLTRLSLCVETQGKTCWRFVPRVTIPSVNHLFFHRQGARQAGLGMMIGPPLLAMAMVAFAHFMGIAVFEWCFGLFGGMLATVFFVVGLRRLIYGGEWGCFVDHHYITWVYPKRTGTFFGSRELPSWLHWLYGKETRPAGPTVNPFQDQQIPLAEVTKFVVQIDPGMHDGDDTNWSYFIETAHGSFQIDRNCFARTGKLARALLTANPDIQLEFRRNTQAQPWDPDHPPDSAAAVFRHLFGSRK
jgi:hypothetical protein